MTPMVAVDISSRNFIKIDASDIDELSEHYLGCPFSGKWFNFSLIDLELSGAASRKTNMCF